MSSSVMRGFSDENGSWKIICICRRSAAAVAGRSRRPGSRRLSNQKNLAGRRSDGPQDAAGSRGLAAAALADQGQGFSPVHEKGHVVHGLHLADDLWRTPRRMGKYFRSPLRRGARSFRTSRSSLSFRVLITGERKQLTCLPAPTGWSSGSLVSQRPAMNEAQAGMEGTARRPVEWVGDRPADGRQLQPGTESMLGMDCRSAFV